MPFPQYAIANAPDPKIRQELLKAADAAGARRVLATARSIYIKEEHIVEEFLKLPIPLKPTVSRILNDILDNKYLDVVDTRVEDKIWTLMLIYLGTKDSVILYWLYKLLASFTYASDLTQYVASGHYVQSPWLNTSTGGKKKPSKSTVPKKRVKTLEKKKYKKAI